MSDIQDLDYTEAITKMNKDQLALGSRAKQLCQDFKVKFFSYIN
jgi:flagellin-like hook-associated protein FlgL